MSDDAATVHELTAAPVGLRRWTRSVWEHRAVLATLAAKDFRVRYKRAAFGVAWAVLLPVTQAIVLVVVFGRLGLDDAGLDYLGYVLAGVTAWSFASITAITATTSIVDGAQLTDKIWFPRALLVLAPVLANGVGLLIGLALVLAVQAVRGALGVEVVWLVPATVLLVALVTGLTMTASALHVYFRDVKFIVQAATLLLFYATPILYTADRLGGLADYLPINPFAGAVAVFQFAFVGAPVEWAQLVGTLTWTVALLVLGVYLQQRNDRIFVDLL